MTAPRPDTADRAPDPVFGFVLVGGGLSGALVRDVRLANELADRGFRVHAWWAIDREPAPLRPQIGQSWLFHGLRYVRPSGSGAADGAGRLLTRFSSHTKRQRSTQKRPRIIERVMEGLIRRACDGVERDGRLVGRFARGLRQNGVTHVLPMLAIVALFVAAARRSMDRPPRYLVTFQGYELYGNYARPLGLERRLYDRFAEVVAGSDWPAVAVSEDYARRVTQDIGVPAGSLRAIPPGVPSEVPVGRAEAAELVAQKFPKYRPGVPLVTYLGRRDVEKGIDLLLYAVSILRARGVDLQVAVCGPTLFGDRYAAVCRQLADDLRCPVLWSSQIPDRLRSALFIQSRCIVYPSIHREPFGMVPVEALAHGTPAVVPDSGGIASAIQADGLVGGLHFRTWDSAHLAEQIERLVSDGALHRRLAEAGPRIAAHYSVPRLADRVLEHLGCPLRPGAPPDRQDR